MESFSLLHVILEGRRPVDLRTGRFGIGFFFKLSQPLSLCLPEHQGKVIDAFSLEGRRSTGRACRFFQLSCLTKKLPNPEVLYLMSGLLLFELLLGLFEGTESAGLDEGKLLVMTDQDGEAVANEAHS